MGWENRIGSRYYYRKRREGRRVVSEYLGRGEFAELYSMMDNLERKQLKQKQESTRRELNQWKRIDQELNHTLDQWSDMAKAILIMAGYHTHKGQWRRYDSGRHTRR